MKASKIFLFLLIGVVVFTGVLWFFLRQTPSPENRTVYKITPIDSQTHAQGTTHSHAGDTPHTHDHERPSDFMIQLVRERLGEHPPPKVALWLAYLESEEGRGFLESFPSTDEWFEKNKSFGFFQETPELQAGRERLYRKHFPTGTVDENTYIIRDMIRDVILEHEHHKEAEASLGRNFDVLIDLLMDEKYLAWVEKKFGSQPPSTSQEWFHSTFEEVRLAEREKYLTSQNNDTTVPIDDFTRLEIEGPPGEGQMPVNTRNVSEDILTVGDRHSDDANTRQAGIETLTPTVPVSPELSTHKTFETALRTQFSPDRFNRAMKTLNQYGPQEGLRRLKSSDPEVAKQVERLLPKPQGAD